MVFVIALLTFFSTLCGGFFALKLKDRLHLILGFSAGAIIGVAFFDLLPEALDLASSAYSIHSILLITAFGFFAYLLLDRFITLHHAHDDGHSARGVFGAASLAVHSFFDGVGIGLGFQVSPAVGAVVAIAVLTHDFSDGINTVGMILKNGKNRSEALRWLLIDACAPVVGIFTTLFFVIEDSTLGLLLALFAGFFLYIGASDLVPESHHKHPTFWTTAMTIFGAALLFSIINIASI